MLCVLQVGGMRYSFNPDLPEDARLVAAELLLPGSDKAVPLSGFGGDVLLLTADYNANGGNK